MEELQVQIGHESRRLVVESKAGAPEAERVTFSLAAFVKKKKREFREEHALSGSMACCARGCS